MARSKTPEGPRTSSEVADSEVLVDQNSEDEILSISNKSPAMPSSVERTLPSRTFWIYPPPRPKDYEDYELLKPPPLRQVRGSSANSINDEAVLPIEIVGEHKVDGKSYYYAEVEGGIIRRFPLVEIQTRHRDLVKEYNSRVKRGTLPKFDPSDLRVHPKDRVRSNLMPKLKIVVKNNHSKGSMNAKFRSVSARSSTLTGLSDDEDEDAVIVSSGTDSDSEAEAPRQSARLANLPKSKRANPRRGLNLRSRGKGKAGSDTFTDDEPDSGSAYSIDDNDDESDVSGGKRKGLKVTLKRARPKRDAIQGLGVIRSISDAEESDSEPEEAKKLNLKIDRQAGGVYLRRHRDTCDRCQERPAHIQLEAYKRRQSKGKRGRKKKKANEDEESEDEEERLERLGGWIRCLRCCMSKHWGCLTVQEKLDVQLAIQKHETEVQNAEKRARGWDVPDDAPMVPKRKSIWLDQATEYVCDMCTRTGPCIICHQDTSPQGVPLAPVAPPAPLPSLTGGSGAEDAIDLTTPPPEPPISVQPATPVSNTDHDSSPTKSTAKPLTKCQPGEVHTTYADPIWHQVLFRCVRCRRPAHWQHALARDPTDKFQRTANQIARVIQHGPDAWKCHDCVRWVYPAESILAWRPDAPDVVENFEPGAVPNVKDPLRREYLIKFKERGFKRVEWVPHMWLVSMHTGLLRNFLKVGTKLPLLEDDSEEFQEKIGARQQWDKGKARELDAPPGFARSRSVSAEADKPGEREYEGTPGPMPDAELRIPDSWLRIDRVLDVRLRLSTRTSAAQSKPSKKGRGKGKGKVEKKGRVTDSEDEDEDEELDSEEQVDEDDSEFIDGVEPDRDLTESFVEFKRNHERMSSEQFAEVIRKRAVWIFTKFEGLQYDECAWDSPPHPGSLGWDSYIRAISRYVFAQSVEVRQLNKKEIAERESRKKRPLTHRANAEWLPKAEDKSLSLMPFQVQGLQWLYGNWWNQQPSILADDMGLGKTVQLVSLIGRLVSENVHPHLIVVPNSTIVNWIREFERWTPHVRVVQFNGDAKARQVIKEYELWNADGDQMYHALVTTYETLHGVEFTPVFKKPGRWEVLVVDEGQRLKSDSSLLFRKLSELNNAHRILMTGTPLNNNIRELFNLMNFLDPKQWNDLDALEKEYDQENLTEELLARLHERLRPYFLRRQKAEVLDLPDKHEVIVPVSLSAIQKSIMKGLIENNLSSLSLLVDKNSRETRQGAAPKKSTLNNVLMEMRKCIQHPYLANPDLERRGLSPEETLKQLVDASTKFRLLQKLLPQLKQRGHRVLLFSQFKIVLDIVEDFLNAEGYKSLRLDGDTKSALRQKDIDDFNRPGSDYFIYILTTRAGGVGVNLWSADTVIVFDPDFNPHQDLQAIARAHRYGQKKRVLVFKFMAKDTPEEKMFMMGKKKLVLDHLIVQKLGDEDEMDDIQGLLTFGAKAILNNSGESASDIKYNDHDIEQLITRAETEKVEEKKTTETGMKFDFAQVYDPTTGATADIPDENPDAEGDDDFWANVIKRAAEEKAQKRAQEKTGRGARKRAVTNYNELDLMVDGSPENPKKPKPKASIGSRSSLDGDRDFNPLGNESSSSDEGGNTSDPEDHMVLPLPGQQIISMPGTSISGPSGIASQKKVVAPLHLGNVPGMPLPGIPLAPPTSKQEKPKKPRKPRAKKMAVPGVDSPGQPSSSASLSKPPPPGPSEADNLIYACQLCDRSHRIGQCPLNSSVIVDKLLSTRAQIMRSDNEDEETHKFWALKHIDKKLAEAGVEIARLPNSRFNDVGSKAKPQRLPTVAVPTASTSGLKSRVPQDNGPNDLRMPSTTVPNGGIPKPRKKKSMAPAADHASIAGLTSRLQIHPQSVVPHQGIPPPQVQPGLMLQSTGNVSASHGIPKTSNGPLASNVAYQAPSNGLIQSASVIPTISKPKVPPVQSLSSSPPPIANVISSAATSAPSNLKKRPANDQPEAARKKRNVECLICGQKPGHSAPECPEVQTPEGIRRAIQRLEAGGTNDSVLRALQRILNRREGIVQ